MNGNSVTLWLQQLREGDQAAAQHLWDRYALALKRLIRNRYRNVLNAVADESDVVQSVFHGLWNGAAAGKWDSVQDRTELWWLLVSITRRKTLKVHTHQTRQKRSGEGSPTAEPLLRPQRDVFAIEELGDAQPPPELLLMLQEEQERLLNQLRDDVLRKIAIRKLEGSTHEEIAEELGIASRTVIRKLNLIRESWSRELES